MNKTITEFIGTFFLVLTIGCTVIGGVAMAPLAIGSVLMVMIFAGGHISGGHYNPAVTLGVWLRGRCPTQDVMPYMISQFLGALGGAVLVKLFRKAPLSALSIDYFPAFMAEFLFSFALVYVVLNVATAKGTAGNSFYGLAIGMTLMAGAFAVGDISGAVFNPAVALAISILGLCSYKNLWLYLIADFLGGALAAGIFKTINRSDH
ncbi:aquaporin [Methylacidiphilum caldifontis]|uniref:MIP/aquaporin family protein n=1 Tax=Methylacidiphilum caldifontis TaxID=2795386 RepID=UPI001A8F98BD|nr:aquaporin [Methylacidiphilum caldifontis]QSR89388.1 aquaporin [Methylacidiphilum caldifontis]